MHEDVVVAAARQLRAEGQRVSLRTVKAITGGSYRDLGPLLKTILSAAEWSTIEAEAAEAAPPPPNQLQLARRAVEVAQTDYEEAQTILDRTTDRLRALQRDRPRPATDPTLVSDVVAAQVEHALQVGILQEESKALEAIVAQRRAERDALRADEQRLRERAHDLRANRLPSLQRELREARLAYDGRVREAEHAVRMADQQVHSLERALAAVAAELARLTGGRP